MLEWAIYNATCPSEIGDSSPPTKPHPLPPPHSPPHSAKRATLWEVATSGSITDVKGFVKVDWSPYPH